jgi:hypothetical protein
VLQLAKPPVRLISSHSLTERKLIHRARVTLKQIGRDERLKNE